VPCLDPRSCGSMLFLSASRVVEIIPSVDPTPHRGIHFTQTIYLYPPCCVASAVYPLLLEPYSVSSPYGILCPFPNSHSVLRPLHGGFHLLFIHCYLSGVIYAASLSFACHIECKQSFSLIMFYNSDHDQCAIYPLLRF